MRINGLGAGAAAGLGIADNSGLVDRIVQAEQAPLDQAKVRKGRLGVERDAYQSLRGMLGDLGGVLDGMKTKAGFTKLAVESSHPDLVDGVVDGLAQPGSYELEVRGLASADKHLAFGFPDADKTEVGFGHLAVEGAQGLHDIVIDPGATLKDVATAINAAGAGVRAQIVNTGAEAEPFRLMVTSLETGAAAKVHLDADTTFLEFQNLKGAKDLDLSFEGVDVQRAGNKLDDLVEGVKLNAKRAAPGTSVTVNVAHDLPKTVDGVKAFADKFNQLAKFANDSFAIDPSTSKPAGKLAGDPNVRAILRSLHETMSSPGAAGKPGSFGSLAAIGLTTDAHTGLLKVDEAKLKNALSSDYEGVAKLFAFSDDGGPGIAARLSDALKRFTNPVDGVLHNREASLDQMVKAQDQQIERQTRRLDERRESLDRQFSAMSSHVNSLNAQQSILSARLGDGDAANAAKQPAG